MDRMAEVMEKLNQRLADLQLNRSTGTSQESTLQTYDCPKCEDRGLILVGENTARICECREKRKRKRLLSQSDLSEDFQRLSFANFQYAGRPAPIVEMMKLAILYRKEFEGIRGDRENSLMLLGQPGAGKTHLLSAVANALIQEDLVEVVYFPYVEGFNSLRDDFDLLAGKIETLKRCEVLFIDDLFKGRQFPTPFQLEQMFAVINHRYLHHLPVLVSSERSLENLEGLDEGIGSRLRDMARGWTYEVFGDRKVLNWRLRD